MFLFSLTLFEFPVSFFCQHPNRLPSTFITILSLASTTVLRSGRLLCLQNYGNKREVGKSSVQSKTILLLLFFYFIIWSIFFTVYSAANEDVKVTVSAITTGRISGVSVDSSMKGQKPSQIELLKYFSVSVHTHTHTHTHIYIYVNIYACTCVCVCVCVWLYVCVCVWLNKASLTSKPARVSSSLIGCPNQSALCHIEAKSFVNYWLNKTDASFLLIVLVIRRSLASGWNELKKRSLMFPQELSTPVGAIFRETNIRNDKRIICFTEYGPNRGRK